VALGVAEVVLEVEAGQARARALAAVAEVVVRAARLWREDGGMQ